MAFEQTLWFFKLSAVDEAAEVLAVARALETHAPTPTRLAALPALQVLDALKSKFPLLKIESAGSSASLDVPSRETNMFVECRNDHVEVTFEGAAETLMEEVAQVLATFGCGCVHGVEYYPPAAPLGATLYFNPDLEAEGRVFGRVRRQLEKQFAGDFNRQREEMDRLYFDSTLRAEVAKLADQLEADYRGSKPREVVARTLFQRFAPVTRPRKVREKLERPQRDTLARQMIEDAD